MKAKTNKEKQELLAMDIFTGSIYSSHFLKNITVAIFDPVLKSLTVEEFYNQWLRKLRFPPEHVGAPVPYHFGSIMGFLYCCVLLAKENWYDLLPEEKIDNNLDWGFSNSKYSSPLKPSPTVQHVFRRIRNVLAHGNIDINVPDNFERDRNDKDDFEKKVILKFHDVNPRDSNDTFDIELSLYELSKAVKKFHSVAYSSVRKVEVDLSIP